MSGINVKVKVSHLISALQDRIAEHNKRMKENEKTQASYAKALNAHKAMLTQAIWEFVRADKFKPLKGTMNDVDWRHAGMTELMVEFRVPTEKVKALAEPPRPADILNHHEVQELKYQVREMENAVRLLQMTYETDVSASTYKRVARYL